MKEMTRREEEVMNFFWEKGPLAVRQIVEFYQEPRPHFNTISTFVRMLEAKGYLGHIASGKTYQYYAIVSRDDFKKMTLKNVVNKYFNNSYLGVVSSFVQEEDISVDELKELVQMIENADKK